MSSKIGLISDTHGLLRDQAIAALQGSDFIIHAGDIGAPEILDALAKIAPLTFVRGNTDTEAWASSWPAAAVLETEAAIVYVLHDLQQLNLNPAKAGFRVVISGHSHRPAHSERDGVLYINPGSAGPRRFRLPITVAHLALSHEPPQLQFTNLANGAVSSDPPASE